MKNILKEKQQRRVDEINLHCSESSRNKFEKLDTTPVFMKSNKRNSK